MDFKQIYLPKTFSFFSVLFAGSSKLSLKLFLKLLLLYFLIIIILTFFFASSTSAQENNSAGQVIVTNGSLQASNSQSIKRSLSRGEYFYSGDTLSTGKNSSGQVRFTDGTLMALNAESIIKISDYIYQKNPQTDKSIVTLVKGGFRALTGLISKENSNAYQIQTPVAVIGVRGTNYATVLNKGQLFAGVWKGGIYLKNDKGLIELGQQQDFRFAQVISRDSAPIGLLNAPVQLVGQCGAS